MYRTSWRKKLCWIFIKRSIEIPVRIYPKRKTKNIKGSQVALLPGPHTHTPGYIIIWNGPIDLEKQKKNITSGDASAGYVFLAAGYVFFLRRLQYFILPPESRSYFAVISSRPESVFLIYPYCARKVFAGLHIIYRACVCEAPEAVQLVNL